jgi:hypothetical protein
MYQLHGRSLLLKKAAKKLCRLVLFAMGQVARTANAAAHTSHALN